MTTAALDAPLTNGANLTWHEKYNFDTAPIPIEPYISEDYFRLEQEHVFRKVWLNVGRIEQLPNPGDYFVKDLPMCRTSLIVTRDKQGQVHAFHNMCAHRGNKVVWNSGGSCQNFTCKFHGWSYGLDGTLKFVPDEESFFDLKKERLGLTPVAIDTWEGFIFVNVDPNPTETLQEYLGEFAERLSGYPFAETSSQCFSWQTEIKCNWKLIKDAFQEAYHVAFLHTRSLPDSFTSRDNPYGHALDFRLFKRHCQLSAFGNPEHQPSPVEALAYKAGSLIIPNEFAAEALPPGVNPTRDPRWSLDLNIFFPNFFVDVGHGTYFTYNFWPLAADRSLWEVRTYFPQAHTVSQRFSQEYSKVIFRDILTEDASTMEQTQQMLASGAKKEFILQDQELLVRFGNRVLADYINGAQAQ